MAKGDAYYLKHDNDAFSDPKIIKLRMLHGFESYALYWRILEMMFNEPDNSLAFTDATFQLIAFETRTTLNVKDVIQTGLDAGLFEFDENGNFYSESLLRRVEDMKAFSELQAEKGRKSGEVRRIKAKKKAEAEQQLSRTPTETNHGSTVVQPKLNQNEPRDEMRRDEMRRDIVEQDEPARRDVSPIYKDVIDYLNAKADKNYKPTTKATQEKIRARLAEGFELDDFKTVIDNKVRHWKGDPSNDRYLRPETLFGPKFESYLQENPNLNPKPKRAGDFTVSAESERKINEQIRENELLRNMTFLEKNEYFRRKQEAANGK